VQNTIDAIRRINKAGILKDRDAGLLSETYVFYRNIETMLRLRNEATLKRDGAALQGLADILVISSEDILDSLHRRKALVNRMWDRLPLD